MKTAIVFLVALSLSAQTTFVGPFTIVGPSRIPAGTTPPPSPTFVSVTTGNISASGATFTLAGFNTSSGNALLVGMSFGTGVGCTGFTFTVASTANGSASGDTFTQIGSSISNTFQCTLAFRSFSIHAATSNTYIVTVTATGTTTGVLNVGAIQFSSVSSIDKNCSGSNTSGSPVTCSASMTPAATPEVIVAVAGDYYFADSLAAGAGYTIPTGGQVNGIANGVGVLAMEYQICSSGCTSTPYTPSMTVTGTGYTNIIGATYQ